jgi:hypothetical protein
MKTDYYSNLRKQWQDDKQKLIMQRDLADAARREYYDNYYPERNGDGAEREGYRQRQNRTRAGIRDEINQRLTEYRAHLDSGKKTWSIHFADLTVSRATIDQINAAEYNQRLAEMWNGWQQYRTMVTEYNAIYYVAKIPERAEKDALRAQNRAAQQLQSSTYWSNYWHTFKNNESLYWQKNFRPAVTVVDEIDNTVYQLLDEGEGPPVSAQVSNNEVLAVAPAEPVSDYYELARNMRATADQELLRERELSTAQIREQREAADIAFAEHSVWSKYRARTKLTRTEKDELNAVNWQNYYADFLTRAGAYWNATTQIRSVYNLRISVERVAAHNQQTASYAHTDYVTTYNRTEYRNKHAENVTSYYTKRAANAEQRNTDRSRADAHTQRKLIQSEEMTTRISYSSYMLSITEQRTVSDEQSNNYRIVLRRSRAEAWQIDIDTQNLWIDNYYPNTRSTRNNKDLGNQKKRQDADTLIKQKHQNYYQELDDYIRDFFEVRNTARDQLVAERKLAWTGQYESRVAGYATTVQATNREREQYDQQVQSEYDAEYAEYINAITLLRELGYNQYARNKAISMSIKENWRSMTGGVLNKQRASYDTFYAAAFHTYNNAILAEQKIHTLASWGYHKVTGSAYYLNLAYRYMVLPLVNGTLDVSVHVKRGSQDSVVYCYRYLIRDRAHDLAVLGHKIYLPISWSLSNFGLERAWNLQDVTVAIARIMHNVAAATGITMYRIYVPVRQTISNIMLTMWHGLSDLCSFAARTLMDLGFLLYRAGMRCYIPITELLGNIATGFMRAATWLVNSFGNLLADSVNNMYALASYMFFPPRFGIEIAGAFTLASLYRAGVILTRAIRDMGQLGYIFSYKSTTPPSRFLYDAVRSIAHLFYDGLKGIARFCRDRIYEVGLFLHAMYRGIVYVCTLLSNAAICLAARVTDILFRTVRYVANAVFNTMAYTLHYSGAALTLAYIPLAIVLAAVANAMQFYTTMLCTGSIRFAHDRKHDIGRQVHKVGIPLAEAANYLGISGAHAAYKFGQYTWRFGDDYVVYPLKFTVSRGFTLSTRAIWDTGVSTSRAAQDVCTVGIRKYHDVNKEVRQRIDPPVIVTGRALYDCGVAVAHVLEFGSKKTYDMLNACSPTHLLERGANRVLSEHASQNTNSVEVYNDDEENIVTRAGRLVA